MWCRGLDACWLHRTATLMIWATFLWAEPCEALEVQRRRRTNLCRHVSFKKKKNCQGRCHCFWTRIEWLPVGNSKGPGKHMWWQKEDKVKELVFLLSTHQDEISLWPDCVRFVLKIKAEFQLPTGWTHQQVLLFQDSTDHPYLHSAPFGVSSTSSTGTKD